MLEAHWASRGILTLGMSGMARTPGKVQDQGRRLRGFFDETVRKKPIITGKTKGPDVITLQPASLGSLAQGSAGLAAWRHTQPTGGTH